jgi:Putative peptidoglycan binding domain
LALALTAGAQMPDNHRKAQQRPTVSPRHGSITNAPQTVPQRTVSNARFRQPAFSTARFRESMPRTTRIQPRTNTSFVNRPPMTHSAAWRQTRRPVSNDRAGSRLSSRPRPSSALVNRSAIGDTATRHQTRPATANDWRESRFSARPRPSNSFVNRSPMTDIAARRETLGEFNTKSANSKFRRQTRQSFNNYWANSRVRERRRTNSSFVNRSRSTAFWSGTRAAVTNNWRGAPFAGRQYWAFHNYQSQWHDRGWWRDHCGDRIVFVTIYSQPFPFFFDAGYWYPAWGYYPDAYYPYDGPIYGYNDLPPDQVIANVQTQLYNEGYYDGPIDGILGPDTRAAIADYQADHGLAVTAAIDEPTVESLGLV